MTKQQRRKIEYEFFNYKRNLETAAGYIAEHAFDGFGVDYSRSPVKSSPRNSVEKAIVRALCEEERAYKWCLVYQRTMDRFRWTQKDELLHRRYQTSEHEVQTCMNIHVERRTYYYWLTEILEVAFLWAQELGLF